VEAALTYLASQVPEGPLLVLVDLAMPRVGGMHLLNAMTSDKALTSTPVMVRTASAESMDVLESFTDSIAGCRGRPYDYAGLVALVITSASTATTDPPSNEPETAMAAQSNVFAETMGAPNRATTAGQCRVPGRLFPVLFASFRLRDCLTRRPAGL